MYPLLPGDARFAAAQDELLHLAGCSLWQVVDEAHPLRGLEVGEIVAHVQLDFVFGDAGACALDDEGMGRFAPFLVRHADDRDLLHGRVAEQAAFDLH